MENLRNDSTSEYLPIAPPLQSPLLVANSQNHVESTNNGISMNDSDSSRRHDEVVILIPINDIEVEEDQCRPPFLTSTIRPPLFHDSEGMLYLLYAGAIVVMYPSLLQLVQLKFQGKQPPSETHAVLFHTAVVAYTIAIPASGLSFYLRARLESTIKKCLYVILKNVFCFSGILAPLSVVLILLIPGGFNWIGYLIILSLFVVIVGCNFGGFIKGLFAKKDDASKLGAVYGDDL